MAGPGARGGCVRPTPDRRCPSASVEPGLPHRAIALGVGARGQTHRFQIAGVTDRRRVRHPVIWKDGTWTDWSRFAHLNRRGVGGAGVWTRHPAVVAPAEEAGVGRDVGLVDVRSREDAPLDVQHVLWVSNWNLRPACFGGRVRGAGDSSIYPIEGWSGCPVPHEQLGQGVVEHPVYRSVQWDPVRGDARGLVVVDLKWRSSTWRGRGKRKASWDGSHRSMQHWGCGELCGRTGWVGCSHCSDSLFVICSERAEFWRYFWRFLNVSLCGTLFNSLAQNRRNWRLDC